MTWLDDFEEIYAEDFIELDDVQPDFERMARVLREQAAYIDVLKAKYRAISQALNDAMQIKHNGDPDLVQAYHDMSEDAHALQKDK